MKIDELANIKRRTEVELSGFLSYQIEKFKICDEIIDIDTLERLHVFTFAEVERAYGEASIEIQSFPKFNLYRENKISYKQKILSYLMDLQEKVNIMGIPASSKLLNAYNSSNSVQTTNPSSNINISNINTNSNKQEQSNTIFLDLIENSIPRTQFREIEAIIRTEESDDSKLEKTKEILSKLGVEFTSSILAKLTLGCLGISI